MKSKYYKNRLRDDIKKAALDDNLRKQIQYRYILKILLVVVLVASAVNFVDKRYTMSGITLLLGAIYYGLYWVIYKLKDKGVKIVNFVMTVTSTIICVAMLRNGAIEGVGPVWILLFPILAFLLMGKETGRLASLVIFFFIVFFYWTPWGRDLLNHDYNGVFLERFPFIYIVMYIVANFYELLRSVMVESLLEERGRMEAVYQNQYSHMEGRIAEARKIRHDLRHHFLMIRQFLKDGQVEEVEEYIDRYYNALPFEEALVYCEHYATNALLTYYVAFAKEKGIPSEVALSMPKEIGIRTEDLTVVLGNLLENAVQANLAGLSEQDDFVPWIRLKGNYDGDALIISIENASHKVAVRSSDGRFVSSKHAGVGIGVHSVQEMVEKYNGVFQVEQPEGSFQTKLIMYAKNDA